VSSPRSWRLFRALGILFGLLLLECGLRTADLPMSWTAGTFDGHRMSLRLWKWWDHRRGGEFNRYGFRDVDWPLQAHAQRVAFVGDSRIYGLYLDSDQTISARYPAHAEGWSGMNFGLVGMTPVELVDGLLDEVIRFSPQAVVLHVDINPSVLGLASRRDFSRREYTVRNLLRSSAVLRWAELGVRAAWAGGDRVRVQDLDAYESDMYDALAQLQTAGVPRAVVLIGWTPMQAIEGLWDPATYDAYRDRSRVAAAAQGAEVIEVSTVLAGMDPGQAFVGPGLHYSAQASDRIAAAVASVVVQ
jgi:hypothetical protein